MFVVSQSGWGLESELSIFSKANKQIIQEKLGFYFNFLAFFTEINTSLRNLVYFQIITSLQHILI